MSLREAILECGTLKQEDVRRLLLDFFNHPHTPLANWEERLLIMIGDDPAHEAVNRWVLALCRIIVAMWGGEKERARDLATEQALDVAAVDVATSNRSAAIAEEEAKPILDVVAPGAFSAFKDLVYGREGYSALPEQEEPMIMLTAVALVMKPDLTNVQAFCGPDGNPRARPPRRRSGLRLVSSRK